MVDLNHRLKQLRDPQKNKVSLRTTRYSRKSSMQKPIYIEYRDQFRRQDKVKTESFLEDAFAILFEQSKDMIEYLPQAVPRSKDGTFKPLEYQTLAGKNETWTPDFAVIWKNRRPAVYEIKSTAGIRKNSTEFKKLLNKWNQSREFANENGFDFYVFSDYFIKRSFRVENIADLETQINYSDRSCENAISQLFEDNRSEKFTITQIQEILSSTSDYDYSTILASVFILIYKEYLFVDFEKEFTLDTPISNGSEIQISLFDWLEMYKFENVEKESNFAVIDHNNLSDKQLQNYLKRRSIILDYKNGMHFKEVLKKHNIGVATLRRLWKRSNKGKDLEKLVRKSGSGRTAFRLFTIDDNFQLEFIDEQFGEAIKFHEQQEISKKKDVWDNYKARVRKVSYDAGLIEHRRIGWRKIREKLDNLPSRDIFYRELNRYIKEFKPKVFRKQFGMKKSQKLMRNVTNTTPYTNYLGQICEIDHTPSNIIGIVPLSIYSELVAKKKGFKIRSQYMDRPIITSVIDLHSRVILGYSFRYRKPSRESTFMAIRRSILGKINPLLPQENQKGMTTANKILSTFEKMYYTDLIPEETYLEIKEDFDTIDGSPGLREVADWWDNTRLIMRNLHTDNGSDLTSKDVQEFGYKYDIQFIVRPVGGANYGGHIERVLKTLNRQAFHSVPGTTGSNTKERGDYPSEEKAILTFEQMEALFLLNILKYHITVHSALEMPPMQAWKEAVKRGDNLGDIKSKKEIIEFAYNTLPVETRSYSAN